MRFTRSRAIFYKLTKERKSDISVDLEAEMDFINYFGLHFLRIFKKDTRWIQWSNATPISWTEQSSN